MRICGRRIDRSATEFKLLNRPVEKRGKVRSRATLLREAWGYRGSVDTPTVDTHMRRLREKLAERSSRIETVRGEGYRFTTGG